MSEIPAYLEELPEGISLQVFNNDVLIFSSREKWLHPLFEFENFLKTYNGPKDDLRSHDSAIGKAAAVLSVRLGIKKINAELLSQNAKNFIESQKKPVQLDYKNLVPKLMCATENQLEKLTDIDEMYFLLRQRAKLVQGVDVKVQNLSYRYGEIKNLDFELKSGGHLMILGENGAGKTTLLRLLAGIYKPDSGSILIDEKPVSEIPKYSTGYIPQITDNVQFDLSVEEVVSLGIKGSLLENSVQQKIEKALERTSSLELKGRRFSSLSGGEKQKVSLARCLAQNARLLLLDEPTASLDAENKKMVVGILQSLTVSEIPTIIVVTHDKELTQMRGWEILELKKTEKETSL